MQNSDKFINSSTVNPLGWIQYTYSVRPKVTTACVRPCVWWDRGLSMVDNGIGGEIQLTVRER